MRVDAVNSTPGTLEGIECPECLNRGYSAVLDGETGIKMVECKCMSKRRSIERIERSGLKDMLADKTMETWQTPERWQAQARKLALQYADKPDGWFVMAGHSGTGKSHLCTALTGLLIGKGMEARYMLWRDVSVRAKAVVNDDYEYRKIIEPLKQVSVLYIDDLFKTGKGQNPTIGDVNLAFEILNHRYNSPKKITIISSELTVEQMLEVDEAVGSRIYEKSKGFYLSLEDMKNWRLKD